MNDLSREEIISLLELSPLPAEGGYFRETYRSPLTIDGPSEITAQRSASTAIFFLVTPTDFSRLHRLPIDEVYHYYGGAPATLMLITDGKVREVTLGRNLAMGEKCQYVVNAGTWQALTTVGEWSLVGTTVAPGFEFPDLELATEQLVDDLPTYREKLRRLLASH